MAIYHALIRTHHMTSRRKITAIREASLSLCVNSILRTGGFPGIMYACGEQDDVADWVKTVKNLRYKDFQLAVKPEGIKGDARVKAGFAGERADEVALRGEGRGSTLEIGEVNEFKEIMRERGLLEWWMAGMGYKSSP
jgi:hypothetical protein